MANDECRIKEPAYAESPSEQEIVSALDTRLRGYDGRAVIRHSPFPIAEQHTSNKFEHPHHRTLRPF